MSVVTDGGIDAAGLACGVNQDQRRCGNAPVDRSAGVLTPIAYKNLVAGDSLIDKICCAGTERHVAPVATDCVAAGIARTVRIDDLTCAETHGYGGRGGRATDNRSARRIASVPSKDIAGDATTRHGYLRRENYVAAVVADLGRMTISASGSFKLIERDQRRRRRTAGRRAGAGVTQIDLLDPSVGRARQVC
jgi:hypothetical protein